MQKGKSTPPKEIAPATIITGTATTLTPADCGQTQAAVPIIFGTAIATVPCTEITGTTTIRHLIIQVQEFTMLTAT